MQIIVHCEILPTFLFYMGNITQHIFKLVSSSISCFLWDTAKSTSTLEKLQIFLFSVIATSWVIIWYAIKPLIQMY